VDINNYIMRNRNAWGLCPMIVCESGLSMSVQATEAHFCEPRNNAGPYRSVEVHTEGRVEQLEPYRGWMGKRHYHEVPVGVVESIVEANGGLSLGKLQESKRSVRAWLTRLFTVGK